MTQTDQEISTLSLEDILSDYQMILRENQTILSENDSLCKKEKTYLEKITDLQQQCDYLKAQFVKIQRKQFGSSKESYNDPNQFQLEFGPDETAQIAQELPVAEEPKRESQPSKVKTKNKPKRSKLDENLPREIVIIEPDIIPEGARFVGEDVTEKLKYIPGHYIVIRYLRRKYAMDDEFEDTKFYIGDLPLSPIHKGIADSSLLSHVLVSKYCDHLPIYRLRNIMKRSNIDIAEGTILGWLQQVGVLLNPLYDYIRSTVLRSNYLQADETTIPVLTKDKPGSTHKGYFWSYFAPKKGAMFFEYQQGRGALFPRSTLAEFEGVLQTDGYAAYNAIGKSDKVKHLGCMAHMRRKFFDAQEDDKEKADFMLQRIRQLYAIERIADENRFSDEDRHELRLKKSTPILDEMKQWLFNPELRFLPKSDIGKAITYARNQWVKLTLYVESGEYIIDNNPIENKFRPIVIGRKNYLFAGSHDAAKRSAIFYTMIAMCKFEDVNPYIWFTDILNRVQGAKQEEFEEMLPINWKKSKA